MTCANVGLAFGWAVANASILLWGRYTKATPLTVLNLMRISIIIMMIATAILVVIGVAQRLVTAPIMDGLMAYGGYWMLRLARRVRDWGSR